MKRYLVIGVTALAVTAGVACGEPAPTPTLAPAEAVGSTATPAVTPTPTQTPTPTSTPTPASAAIPAPTPPRAPTTVQRPDPTPRPTATWTPTAAPTLTPSPSPAPTLTSAELIEATESKFNSLESFHVSLPTVDTEGAAESVELDFQGDGAMHVAGQWEGQLVMGTVTGHSLYLWSDSGYLSTAALERFLLEAQEEGSEVRPEFIPFMVLGRLLKDKAFPFFRGLVNFSLETDLGDILSMDDETTGGRRFHVLSFSFDAMDFYERIDHPRAGTASVTRGNGQVWIDADTLLRDRLTLEVEGQDLLEGAFKDIYRLTYSLYDGVKIPIAGATPATELEKMLGQAPDIPWGLPVSFTDVEGQLRAAGFSHVTSVEALYALTGEEKFRLNRLARPCAAIPGGRGCERIWGETFGFSVFDVERSIVWGSSPTLLGILTGDFDPNLISAKLQEQDYEVKSHEGQPYYSYGSDYQFSLKRQMAMSRMNRVAATERTLISAPETQLLLKALDTGAGSFPSLQDNPVYLAIANSMGPVLAGQIRRDVSLGTGDYLGIGYRSDGADAFLVISVLYRDTAAAEQKAAPITKAMKEHVRAGAERTLEDEYFSAVSSRADVYAVGSILTIEAKLKDPARSRLWFDLLWNLELGFLEE